MKNLKIEKTLRFMEQSPENAKSVVLSSKLDELLNDIMSMGAPATKPNTSKIRMPKGAK